METLERKPRKQRSLGLWIAVVILLVFLSFSVMLNFGLGFVVMLSGGDFASGKDAQEEYPEFKERWTYGRGEVKAVTISLEGLISRETGGGFLITPYNMVAGIQRQLRAAANDEDVSAVILEINSPGGGLTASDEIYHSLIKFKESRQDRKIVVYVKDLAASGGYLAAMAGDWIIAQPTSLVGSIGVIVATFNWHELAQKMGIKDASVISSQSENKDLLNPFEPENEEQRAIMQELVDEAYVYFLDLVQQGRKLDKETLKPLADGRIVTAKQALDNKLIDQVGYWEDVRKKTAELLNESDIKIIEYERPTGLLGMLGANTPIKPRHVMEMSTPRLMVLWSL